MIETRDFTTPKEMDEWVNAMGRQNNVFATQTFRTWDDKGNIISYSATVFWREEK